MDDVEFYEGVLAILASIKASIAALEAVMRDRKIAVAPTPSAHRR